MIVWDDSKCNGHTLPTNRRAWSAALQWLIIGLVFGIAIGIGARN
jgi:hypothetical protein